jgi:Flp pilus assembly protein TadB
MQCRQCGTEIAEKALICYRCGTATSEARVKPPAPGRRGRRSPLLALVALLALVIGGLFMGQAVHGELPQVVGYVVAALAAIVLVWRLAGRR